MIYSRALTADEVEQIFEAEGLPVQPQGKLATRWAQIKSSR